MLFCPGETLSLGFELLVEKNVNKDVAQDEPSPCGPSGQVHNWF